MCGLAGIFSYAPNAPLVDHGELVRMRDHMLPRGPDGAGLWLSSNGVLGLAHRRLSIIDLSSGGAQPMLDPATGNQIVFNGEIYNYLELRRDLERSGYQFRSSSDTEVLLKLYAHSGVRMVERLRGMFAFAVWDTSKGGLFLARDQFGIKPLYFSDNGGTIRFASQVKALVAGGAVDMTPEPAGHVGFLLWGHVPEPFTMYKGIRAVPAGTSMWIDGRGCLDQAKYFRMADIFANATSFCHGRKIRDEEAKEVLGHALVDTVSHHMIADVPVGVFLSAGLDSTTLAALACLESSSKVRTVTLGFEEFQGTSNDEVPLAQRVSEYLGTDQHTCIVRCEDFAHEYSRIMAAMDQPSIDGVNTYFVSKAARKAGLKVALSGLGGDEIFAGYSTFSSLPRLTKGMAPLAAIPGAGKLLRKLLSPVFRRFASPKIAGLVEYGGDFAPAYLLVRGLYMPWEIERLLDRSTAREGMEKLQTIQELSQTTANISSEASRITALECGWYMKNQLLRDSDWASMAHSLELRVPLLDIPLLRTVANLHASGWKPSKRDMALSAPIKPLDVVLNRRKTGFSVPVRDWVTGRPYPDKTGRIDSRRYTNYVISQLRRQGAWQIPYSDAVGCGGSAGLLATEAISRGGVQSFMIRVVEVMDGLIGSGQLRNAAFFSLNDTTADMREYCQLGTAWLVKGGNRRKLEFVMGCLSADVRLGSLIVGHLSLGPLALAMHWLGKVREYNIILHGIEAWEKANWINRLGLKYANSIIATTTYTAEACAKVNSLDISRFRIIPLCADESQILPDPTFELRGMVKLLCVARQDPSERYKGFEMLMDAVRSLVTSYPTIHLNLIGSGADQERLKDYADKNGLASHVTFWGAVSDAALAKAYQSCDIYVMPSKKEGFGIVFLEAMIRAKPCIGGRHGGTPDVIEDGRSGYLVDYGNTLELIGCISSLVANARLRSEMGARGRELIDSRFSWNAFKDAYSDLLN